MRSVRESDDCGEFGADYSGPAIALLNDANQLNHLSKPLPEYSSGRTADFTYDNLSTDSSNGEVLVSIRHA